MSTRFGRAVLGQVDSRGWRCACMGTSPAIVREPDDLRSIVSAADDFVRVPDDRRELVT